MRWIVAALLLLALRCDAATFATDPTFCATTPTPKREGPNLVVQCVGGDGRVQTLTIPNAFARCRVPLQAKRGSLGNVYIVCPQ